MEQVISDILKYIYPMCVKLCDRVYIYLNTYMCKSNTKYWLINDKMKLMQFLITCRTLM